MTADSQWPVQQAVYDAIRADATLRTLISNPVRVYSMQAPQETDYPYITIGDGNGSSFDTKTTDGMELVFNVHTWSRYRGAKQALEIMGAINDAIDEQSLTIAGHSLIVLRFDASVGPMLDPDGHTLHGVQRFRVITEG